MKKCQKIQSRVSVFVFIIIATLSFGLLNKSGEALAEGDPTITITATNMTAVVDVPLRGGFVTTSGSSDISFTVSTDNNAGYTLSVRSSKTTLDNGQSSIAALSEAVTAEQFGASSATNLNNKWGFKPNYYGSEINDKYYGVSTSSVVIDRTTAADLVGKTYTVSLGARIGEDLLAGAYSNESVVFEAVANTAPAMVTIVYDGNGADAGSMSLMKHEDLEFGDEVMLYASNYSKVGYGFLGWSFDSNATVADFAQNEAITVNGDLLFSADINGIITLYAVWEQPTTTMQAFSCDSLTNTGDTVVLTDIRDGNAYTVRKLADGQCWMVDNLRLDIGTANITWKNTNNPDHSFLTKISSAQSTTATSWCKAETSACIDQVRYNSDNTASRDSEPTDDTGNIYYYGNYYNHYTATAGRNTYSESGTTNAAGDICPQNWHLPTGGTTGDSDWAGLSVALGGLGEAMSTATTPTSTEMYPVFHNYPTGAVNSGHITNGAAIKDRSVVSRFWTATNNSGVQAYNVHVDKNTIHPGTNAPQKFNGYAVRCVAGSAELYKTIYYDGDTLVGDGSSFRNGYGFSFNSSDSDNTFHLEAPDLEKEGYGFAGWSADPNAASTINLSNQPRIFGPNETYTTSTSDLINVAEYGISDNIGYSLINLYAVWVPSIGNFQTWTGCSSLSAGNVIALTDSRDGNTYAVAKLADGKCWMIENNRIDPGASSATITASNTNNPTSSFLSQIANAQSTPLNGFCDDNNTSCDDAVRYNTDYIKLDGNGRFSYGAYYNWYTATAGNGTYSSTDSSASSSTAGDLCPYGWRMPTSSNYSSLMSALNSDIRNLFAYPNNAVYAGIIIGEETDGKPRYNGGSAYYMVSSPNTYNAATRTLFAPTSWSSSSNYTIDQGVQKNRGQSFRCLAK